MNERRRLPDRRSKASPGRRGRPSLSADGERSADVCVKMPSDLYDQTYQKAAEQRVSVPELIRRAIRRALASAAI